MVNPKSLANLKQFQKGEGGRKHGAVSITTTLREYCRNNPDKVRHMVEEWVKNAETSPAFAQLVADRIDGKVAQPVSGGLNITHTIAFEVGKGYKE